MLITTWYPSQIYTHLWRVSYSHSSCHHLYSRRKTGWQFQVKPARVKELPLLQDFADTTVCGLVAMTCHDSIEAAWTQDDCMYTRTYHHVILHRLYEHSRHFKTLKASICLCASAYYICISFNISNLHTASFQPKPQQVSGRTSKTFARLASPPVSSCVRWYRLTL